MSRAFCAARCLNGSFSKNLDLMERSQNGVAIYPVTRETENGVKAPARFLELAVARSPDTDDRNRGAGRTHRLRRTTRVGVELQGRVVRLNAGVEVILSGGAR